MSRVTAMVLAHAVVAGALSLVTAWVGTGIVLSVLPPLLLMRFVRLDREATMTGAMLATALLAVMASSKHGAGAAVTVSLGGFLAAEVAARGARLHRAAPLPRLKGDLLPTLAVVVVASVATLGALALSTLRVPAAASVAGLALLVTALFAWSLRHDSDTAPTGASDLSDAGRGP